MRLFLAIELPEAARAAIRSVQDRIASSLGSGATALRFVRPEHLHVTVLFLGEVAPPQLEVTLRALEAPLERPPFRLMLGTTGVFPARGAPRVVWLGVTDGIRDLAALNAALASRLPPQDGSTPFVPHVTLARWRRAGARRRPVLPPVDARLAAVQVDSVALFESRLSSAGPAYTAVRRIPLTCRSAC